MNFHKTIGYLAALLLMVGIGVPDSFAQEEVTKVSLSLSSRTLRDSTTTPVTVTATVDVTLADAADATNGQNVTIAISDGTGDDSYALTGNTGLAVTVAAGKTTGRGSFPIVFTFDSSAPQGDVDPDDEKITVTATVAAADHGGDEDVESTGVVVTITDHAATLTASAQSVRGMRVIIQTPAAGAWAPTGNNKIKVRVLRKGQLAAEFGAFTEIKVGLHDDVPGVEDETATPNPELYSITISDDVKLGSLIVPRIRTDELSSDATDAASGNAMHASNNRAVYTRRPTATGYDVLEFIFHLTGGASYENVYAVATFGLTGAPTGAATTIESRDTKTSIFPPAPAGLPKVGDGKFIKIDAGAPANSIVSAITVTIIDRDGEEEALDANIGDSGTPTVYAGIGEKIKISAAMVDFPEKTLGFQLIGRDIRAFPDPDDATVNVNVTGANQALDGLNKTFGALAVLGSVSQGKPVEYTFDVTANMFKRKANLVAHPGGDFKKNQFYEDDNVIVRVQAFVKDRAGNNTVQTPARSAAFILDSRPPKVTITYPKPSGTDSTRFTAAATQNFDFIGTGTEEVPLKPLNFKTDEATSQNQVIIDTDTLLVAGLDSGPLGTLDGGYNLTDSTAYALKERAHDDEDKRPEFDSKQGGAAVNLQVAAFDLAGNKGIGTPDGGDAIFDAKAPKVNIGFPTNAALKELDNKIGGPEQTQHPVFTVNEATDSILVRYEGGGAVLSVAGTDADEAKVNQNIKVKFMGDNALIQGQSYTLQVYARDLAGQVGVSDPEGSMDLVFDSNLQNPGANGFDIVSEVRDNTQAKGKQAAANYTKIDSVVAGQALRLTITAMDDQLDRTAITYAKAGVKVVTMDSDGNMVASANYWGDGVTNNGDGSATLDDAGWSIGSRAVFVNTDDAGGPYSVVAKDMAADGTLNFMGTKEGITVDAADFAKFKLTAWEDGVDGAATSVWEDFDLRVVPIDKFGNPSLKTFFDQTPGTKKADSLNILDTRLANSGNSAKKYSEVNIRFSDQLVEDLPTSWRIGGEGRSFSARALNRPGREATIRVDIDNTFLDMEDARSRNKSGEIGLQIQQPLTLVHTLWGPNGENWTDESEITIPAGGEVEVTFLVEGAGDGGMVTFTKNGTAMDPVAADEDGNAKLAVTLSGSGSVTVSAAVGQYLAGELSYTYAEQEGRMAYVDDNGDAVYLVDLSDNTVNENDIMAFVGAYLSNAGDANYNPQADANDDGTVDDDDLALIVTSWLKTAANGPATKPIVLPGVNANAEFALNLGSERVIAGEMIAVDVSLANVEAVMGYGFNLNYDAAKFEFVSVAPADEDLLKSTGGETLFHHVPGNGQVQVVTGLYNGTAVSGGGDIVRFVFRVLYEFEDNARFEIANGLVFDPSQLSNPAVVAGVLELQSTPREFALHQNFPNPFNPDTTIKYDLAESADVTLQIYNVLGQVVRTLVASEAQNAGRYQIRWNGMDERGVPVSSGIYFYQISADGKFSDVRKLMLLK